MNDFQISEEIKNLFIDDLLKDNFTYPNHNFSLRYKFQKNKIIKKYKREHSINNTEATNFKEAKARIPLKCCLKYILIIIVLMALLGFTVYRYYSGLFVREYDVFSMLSVEYNENSPQVLIEKFYIDMDLSEYEKEIIDDDEMLYWVKYKIDGETQFEITQTTLAAFTNVRLNTENVIIMPTDIDINGWKGMYFQTHDGTYIYYFNCGSYIMSYFTNSNPDKIEKLVKSTKFA